MSEVIWQDDSGLTITASDRAGRSLIDYLASIPFGSGGTRYWRLNVEEQLKRFERPTFLSLRDDDTVIGSYVLDRQALSLDGEPCSGLYRGLLSIHPERRNAGLGRELATHSLNWAQAGMADGGGLSYGVVDNSNTHSLALLETLGMQRIGTLYSMLEYRQWRGRQLSDLNVHSTLTDDARLAWQAQRADGGLASAHPAKDQWLTVSDNGGNVAACRHHVTELRLGPIGGVSGFIVEKMMPLFPPGHRRFNPRRFRYVSIADPVVPAGSEALWKPLVSQLMAAHDTHFVRFTLDPQSTSVARLRDAGAIGRLAWRTRTELAVMAAAHDRTLALKSTRLHLSAKDL